MFGDIQSYVTINYLSVKERKKCERTKKKMIVRNILVYFFLYLINKKSDIVRQ